MGPQVRCSEWLWTVNRTLVELKMFLCDTQTSLCKEKPAVTSCCSTVSAALHALSGSLTDVVPHCFSWHLANRWPWLSDAPLTSLAEHVSLHWWAHIWWRGGGRFHEWFRENVSKCWKTGSVGIYREISKHKTFFTAVAGWTKGNLLLVSDKYRDYTDDLRNTTMYKWIKDILPVLLCGLCVFDSRRWRFDTASFLLLRHWCHWSTSICNSRKQRAKNDSCATRGAEKRLNETWKGCLDWEDTSFNHISHMRCSRVIKKKKTCAVHSVPVWPGWPWWQEMDFIQNGHERSKEMRVNVELSSSCSQHTVCHFPRDTDERVSCLQTVLCFCW